VTRAGGGLSGDGVSLSAPSTATPTILLFDQERDCLRIRQLPPCMPCPVIFLPWHAPGQHQASAAAPHSNCVRSHHLPQKDEASREPPIGVPAPFPRWCRLDLPGRHRCAQRGAITGEARRTTD